MKRKISFAEFVSTFTYLYSLSVYVIAALQLVIGLLLLLPGFPPLPRGERTLLELLVGVAIFFYSYFMLFYLADWVDNRIPFRLRTLPRMVVSCVANTIVAVISQIVGCACTAGRTIGSRRSIPSPGQRRRAGRKRRRLMCGLRAFRHNCSCHPAQKRLQ